MSRRSIVGCSSLVAALLLAGCSAGEPVASPAPVPAASLTVVPSPTFTPPPPSPVPKEPLASAYGVSGPMLVTYEETAWASTTGCGCTDPAFGEGELYPAGTPVWALRVKVVAVTSFSATLLTNPGDSTTKWGWGEGLPPFVEAEEGRVLAEQLDLPFGWDEFVAANPAMKPGDAAEFLLVGYVPANNWGLRMSMWTPPNLEDRRPNSNDYTLEVPLTPTIVDFFYTE